MRILMCQFGNETNTFAPGRPADAELLTRAIRCVQERFREPLTLEEVGQRFNITRERIRQIEAKALRKLRYPLRSKQLRDYLDS